MTGTVQAALVACSPYVRPMLVTGTDMVILFCTASAACGLKRPKRECVFRCFVIFIYSFFVLQVLILNVLGARCGEADWYAPLYLTAAALNSAAPYWLGYTVYPDGLKGTFWGIIGECVGIVLADLPVVLLDQLEGLSAFSLYYRGLSPLDLLIPVVGLGLYGILYHFFRPFLYGFRKRKLRHPVLVGVLLAVYTSYAYYSWVRNLFPDQEDSMRTTARLTAMVGFLFFLGALLLFFSRRERAARLRREEGETRREELAAYYDAAKRQEETLVRYREETAGRTRAVSEEERGGDGETRPEEPQNYLSALREREPEIPALFYCDEPGMNAFLSRYAQVCEEKGIRTEFLLQGYRRGSIEEKNLIFLLRQCMDAAICALEDGPEPKLSLRMKEMKGELVISLTASPAASFRLPSGGCREILRRYRGHHKEVREGDAAVLALFLECGRG